MMISDASRRLAGGPQGDGNEVGEDRVVFDSVSKFPKAAERVFHGVQFLLLG
jgi:hypothetical protein